MSRLILFLAVAGTLVSAGCAQSISVAHAVSAMPGRVCAASAVGVRCTGVHGREPMMDGQVWSREQFSTGNPCMLSHGDLLCFSSSAGWRRDDPTPGFVLRYQYQILIYSRGDELEVRDRAGSGATVLRATVRGLSDVVGTSYQLFAVASSDLVQLRADIPGSLTRRGAVPTATRLALAMDEVIAWAPGSTTYYVAPIIEDAAGDVHLDHIERREAPAFVRWVAASPRGRAICMILEPGRVACEADGDLHCDGRLAARRALEPVPLGGSASALSVGPRYACAVVDGSVTCWGDSRSAGIDARSRECYPSRWTLPMTLSGDG